MEFTLKATFRATAHTIYKSWLNGKAHGKMTGAAAVASDAIGDYFTAWDGYIIGKNLELEPNKRILQSWRTSDFDEDDEDSLLEIVLSEKGDVTEVSLHHSGLPENGEQYIKGWQEHYFTPMKAHFEG